MALKVGKAPGTPDTALELESTLTLPHFTATDAWVLGHQLRGRLHTHPTPVVISISLANGQLLFHTVTHSGATPDNDIWVRRKRATVLRWGCSTWLMQLRMKGDEDLFCDKYALGESAGDYAIHGGGIPICVNGVEGTVGVIVVSGLQQAEGHMCVVEALQELQRNIE